MNVHKDAATTPLVQRRLSRLQRGLGKRQV